MPNITPGELFSFLYYYLSFGVGGRVERCRGMGLSHDGWGRVEVRLKIASSTLEKSERRGRLRTVVLRGQDKSRYK